MEFLFRCPLQKSPLFNYISFIQTLSFYRIERVIESALTLIDEQINTSNNQYLILKELSKAFMNQISSLKTLNYDQTVESLPFFTFPGVDSCLTNILEFRCSSNVCPNQLS